MGVLRRCGCKRSDNWHDKLGNEAPIRIFDSSDGTLAGVVGEQTAQVRRFRGRNDMEAEEHDDRQCKRCRVMNSIDF